MSGDSTAHAQDGARPTRALALPLFAFVAASVLAGGLGHRLTLSPGLTIILWPPAGIFLATLLLSTPRAWPRWIGAACAAELAGNALWFHNPLHLALVYFTGNALEAVTGALLLRRFAPRPFRLESLADAGWFTVLGAGVAPIVGAAVIASTDAVLGKHPFLTAFGRVWLGDGTGILLAAPPTLFAAQAWRERHQIPRARLVEAALLLAGTALVCAAALRGLLPSIYTVLPMVVWGAARFQLRGAAMALAVIVVVAAALNPAAHADPGAGAGLAYHDAVYLQTFLAVGATCAIVVGALSLERERALAAGRAAAESLEQRVRDRTAELRRSEARLRAVLETDAVAVLFLDREGVLLGANDVFVRMTGYTREQITRREISWRTLTPPGSAGTGQAELDEIALTGRISPCEKHCLRADGTRAWMLVAGRDLGDGTIVTYGVDTSALKAVELALAESEARFRTMADTSPIMIWVSDAHGDVELVNRAYLEFFGVAETQVRPPGTWKTLVHPDDAPRYTHAFAEAVRGRTPFTAEARVRRADGAWRWIASRASPRFDASGAFLGHVGTSPDVTERVQAEHDLRERERALQSQRAALEAALRNAPLAEALGALVRTVTERLGAGARAAFYLADAEGRSLRHVCGMSPEYAATIDGFRIGADSIACGLAVHSNRPVLTPDVTVDPAWEPWRWLAERFEFRACWSLPLTTTSDRVLGSFAIYAPGPRAPDSRELELLTQVAHTASMIVARHAEAEARERAEHALAAAAATLARERQCLELALHTGGLGVYEWRPGDGALWWSPELFHLFGLDPAVLTPTAENFDALVHPDDRAELWRKTEVSLADASVFMHEYRIVRPDGQVRWVANRSNVGLDPDGRPERVTGVVMDITERRCAEEELRVHRQHLEELVARRTSELEDSHQRLRLAERLASLGTLAAGLGHDMGNLLLPMRVHLETLEGLDQPDSGRDALRAIRASAAYLQKLSSGLRLLAVDPASPARGEATELLAFWAEAEPVLRGMLPRTVALTADLPSEPVSLAIGRAALMQVVFNLVQNAGDVMAHQRSGRVTIRVTTQASTVALEVVDDGPGMTDEVRRRCMEPFFSTKPRGLSTGLGLALVYGIVTDAGGSIELASEPGKGATFTITLPRARHGAPGSALRGRAMVDITDARLRAFVLGELRYLGFDPGAEDGEVAIVVCDRARDGLRGTVVSLAGKTGMLEVKAALADALARGSA